ncbi:MAG: SLBB domain-containing protein [Candidatus Eisenbacteria sp.]|nr:SLBB domain-containing protein [Candidatus Eisenbacteria bacterium]
MSKRDVLFLNRTVAAGLCALCLILGAVGGGPARVSAQTDFPDWLPEQTAPETGGQSGPGITPLEGKIDRATYRLGPGDRLALWLSGERVEVRTLDVSPEGMVFLDPAGPVQVCGLSVEAAEETVRRALSGFLRNTLVRLQLVDVRRFRVHVLGEVSSPGVYVATAVERVAGIIEMAEGVAAIGSRRNIALLRSGGGVVPVDLVAYEVSGCLENNPLLREGDVVHVPPMERAVRILGAVFRPGLIELRSGETVADLIALAGGPEPGAFLQSVEIERFSDTDPSDTERLFLNLTGYREGRSVDGAQVLKDGDRVFLRSIPKWHEEHAVLVTGEVQYPGWYAIEENLELLSHIVKRAGGFTPFAALREATVVRAERDTVIDREFERLKNMPVVDMTKTEYEYFKFRSRERRGQMVVDFEKLFLENDSSHDLILRNLDVVNIPHKPLTVAVEGQVASPGHVIHVPDRGVDYYIEQAGGYSWNANRGKTRVIRVRSGEWKWPGDVDSLEPGDTIWIPEKREIEWWELFKDVARVLAELATVYLVVDSAMGN